MAALTIDRTVLPSVSGQALSEPGIARQSPPIDRADSYIAALAGIRGLAVLLVLCCHSTMIEPGGALGKLYLAATRISWAGVDLFFVLSGFLITGILFDAKGKANYFRNFYARRTVRIFPLYYVFLLVFLVALPRLIPTSSAALGEFPHSIWSYGLYLSNFYQSLNPTHHVVFVSWSLAIEEQFYLVWPLVVFLCGRRALLRICVGAIAASVLLRVFVMFGIDGWIESYGWRTWAIANNFTFCRLDGLAAGAWIALVVRNGGNAIESIRSMVKAAWIAGAAAAVALSAIVGIAYVGGWRGGIGQSPGYVIFGYPVLAVLFGSLLISAVAAKRGAALNRVFTSRFLAVFGKYSYAVYLLHSPVNVFVRRLLLDPSAGASSGSQVAGQIVFYLLSGTFTLVLSWLSWHLMEKHFLKLKALFPMEPSKRASVPDGPRTRLINEGRTTSRQHVRLPAA